MTRHIATGATFIAVLAALHSAGALLERRAGVEAADVQAPAFEVDPMWPKPLPNHWIMGWTVGVAVDQADHVWVVHRPDSLEPPELYGALKASECCFAAPPVLEFDPAGNLVSHFGGPGPGYDWPEQMHGVTPDSKGNIWLAGSGANDGQILKFTRTGTFVRQFGFAYASAGSNDLWAFNKPAKVTLDERANEAYISDGYGNRRVAVIDADTGKIKRYWGAYGKRPSDENLGRYNPDAPAPQQFRNPVHCAEISNDGLLYVCDRVNDRIQVFRKDGTFVKEAFVAKRTLGDGSAFDIAFSRDPQQKFLYLADGSNEKVHIMLRDTLEVLTTFGDGGRQPGQFYAVHSIAADSRGNLFTAETRRGQRVQKFVYRGLAPVTKKDQGVLWPRSGTR
jgi:DNA-binding beta-propeller fold protein YncE